jgi:hypothetical protein
MFVSHFMKCETDITEGFAAAYQDPFASGGGRLAPSGRSPAFAVALPERALPATDEALGADTQLQRLRDSQKGLDTAGQCRQVSSAIRHAGEFAMQEKDHLLGLSAARKRFANRRIAGSCLLAVLLAAQALPAADSLPDGRWAITLVKARPANLSGAVGAAAESDDAAEEDSGAKTARVTPDKPTPQATADDIELVLERTAGAWSPLFSAKERLFGLVEWVESDGALSVLVLFDAMGRNNNLFKGPGVTSLIAYRLVLRVAADGAVSGEWTSPTAGKGVLNGRVLPMPRAVRPAPPLGEHPRFLLRAEDLPALKAKAATPWGQSLVKHLDKDTWSRSGHAVGLGLLYRLTGDAAYARRARDLVLQDIRSGWWDIIGPVHDPPHKIMEAVYAWDLIHDACGPEFDAELKARLRPAMRFMDNFCDMDRGNGHPHSNWSAQFQTGVGMAGLGLLADPSGFVEPDPSPDIPVLTPPADPLPDGLPVFAYDSDARQITRWLVAGPFDIGLGNDGLAALGGAAKARVYEGLRFPLKIKATESKEVNDKDGVHYIHQKNAKKFSWSQIKGDDLQPLTKEIEGVFRRFPPEWICSSNTYAGWPGAMDLRIASGYRSYRTFYLAAALKVPEPVTVIVRFQNQQRDDPCVYLAGRKLRVNDVVRLEPGVYPVLHPVTYTTFLGSHGRDEAIYHGFHLVPAAPEQKAKMASHLALTHQFVKRCRAALAGRAEADFWPRLWLAHARAMMDEWATHAVSEGGWNIAGDCYTLPSLQALAPFAHAHANATGVALGSPGHLGAVLPHQVHKTVFDTDRAFTPAFGRGGGPYGPMPYARCFGFVEPALRPAVGWAAHRTLDLALAGKLRSENLVVDELDPLSAAFALFQWPAPEDARPPEGIVPLSAADRQRSCWTFRNRFRDGEDAVAAFAGFIHPGGDWGDVVSGEFRLAALGNEWAVRGGGVGRTGAQIPYDNVVRPAVVGDRAAWPPVVYREISRRHGDNAAAVTLDMVPLTRKVEAQEQYGAPLGARTFLTDFSGACGAPVLVVVRDVVPTVRPPPTKTAVDDAAEELVSSGAGKTEDEDLLPAAARKRPPPGPYDPPVNSNAMHRWTLVTLPEFKVTMRPDGFTLAATNGATLNATVLLPVKPRLWKQSGVVGMELNYRHDHRGGGLRRQMITVGGYESFLVAMTVQRGETPPAVLAGDVLSVGKQRFRLREQGLEPAP